MSKLRNKGKKISKEQIQEAIKKSRKELKKTYNIPESEIIIENRASILSNLAIFHWDLENLSESRKYFLSSLQEFEKLNDEFKIASSKGALGSLFLQMGEYGLSQKYNEDAYNFWKKTNFLNERIACLQNLGIIYLRLKQEVKASDAILEALRMSISLQDENQFASTIQILLEYYEKQKRYDMVLEFKKKALEFWDSMNLTERQFKTLIDLGVISQILEEHSFAKKYFKKAFNIAYNSGNLEKMFLAQGFIAESYLKLKNIKKAKKTYLQAFKLAVYVNKSKNFKEHVDSMRLALLTLGESKENLIKEGQKALEEADVDMNN